MAGKKGKKSKKGKRLTVKGPWGTKFSMPVGQLPIKIGSDRSLSSSKSVYPPMVKLSVPIVGQLIAVAAGAVANAGAISATNVNNFATRFASLFDEYCIVGMALELRIQNVTAGSVGFVLAFIDEKIATAPNAASLNVPRIDMMIGSESPSRYDINWIAHDYIDLQWTQTSTTVIPLYLKIYASNANTLTSAGTACDILISGTLQFCFRGYS
jgi:hypothetical protein